MRGKTLAARALLSLSLRGARGAVPAGLLSAALVLSAAQALAEPSLRTSMVSRQVEVNTPFSLELLATGDGAERGGAFKLALPRGFEQSGPSVASYRSFSFGRQLNSVSGLRASWRLIATKTGVFTIGPASIQIDGRRYAGDRIKIEVVARGSAPRSGNPFDPLGLGRHGFPGLFDDDDNNPADDLFPAPPEEYRTDNAPDSLAFLRAEAVPASVVIGEPLLYRAYAYGGNGPFNELRSSEPTRADFLAYPVIENSLGGDAHRVRIGDKIFTAVKIRETILVPIKTGELEIGPINMGFGGPAYAYGSSRGLMRESGTVRVRVVQPPALGRPIGYNLGDVGNFVLRARVEPRTVEQGESVSIVVRLEGQGNLPAALKPPQQNGVEWLEPNVQEQIEPSGGSLGGWRKFSYTARLTQAGELALGSFKLPYWNPRTRRYETAEADLGSVRVTPSHQVLEDDHAAGDARLDLAPRTALGAANKRSSHPTDHWYYWLLLLGGPMSVLLARVVERSSRNLKGQLAQRRDASSTLANAALAKARVALKSGDAASAAGELERALLHGIEGATGVRARGVLRADLPSTLSASGAESAEPICQLLDELDAVRFTGAPLAADALDRARGLLRSLHKQASKGDHKPSAGAP